MREDLGDYSEINKAWGDQTQLPKPTMEEAARAIGRLYRKWTGKPWRVNGRRLAKSWPLVVHDASHYAHWRLHPGENPHDFTHAVIESEMIEHVLQSGWLEGKLRPKPKPAIDPSHARYESICQRIARWERKEKRAANALQRLRRKRAYYERKGIR